MLVARVMDASTESLSAELKRKDAPEHDDFRAMMNAFWSESQDYFDSMAPTTRMQPTDIVSNEAQAVKVPKAVPAQVSSPPSPVPPMPMSLPLSAPAVVEQPPMVNVMLIIDPAQQKVTCPPQMLSVELGGKTHQTWIAANEISFLQKHWVLPDETGAKQGPAASQHYSAGIPSLSRSSSPSNHSIDSNQNQQPVSPLSHVPAKAEKLEMPPSPPFSSGPRKSSPASRKTGNASPTPPCPLRALSAYNYFYRDERDRMVHGSDNDWSQAKQKRLLAEHLSQQRTKKRRHRKMHGKIDFFALSKIISKRWRELPEEQKSFYQQIAAKDLQRYQSELKAQQEEKQQQQLSEEGSAVPI